MSTFESRAHDAWVDAHTVHATCGLTLDRCDCLDPEPPIPCDHHQRLLDAVHAERPGADLTALATAFATDCDHCEVP